MDKARIIKNYNPFLIISLVLFIAFLNYGVIFGAGVEDVIASAQRLHDSGDYQAEIVTLAEALKEDPDNTEIIKLINNAQKLLDARNKQTRAEKIERIVNSLNRQAEASYDKGELKKAIRLWAKVLIVAPDNDSAAWMIQKTQRRMQLEAETAGKADAQERDYSRKIQRIVGEISKLMDDANERIQREKEQRRKEELEVIKENSRIEELNRQAAVERVQRKEENFITDTFNRGQEYYREGKYDEAMREWESILPLLSKDNKLRGVIEPLRNTAKQRKQELDARQFAIEEAFRRAAEDN